jgi:hypothetical protein
MPEKVVNTIKRAEDVGKAQYNQFVADCINDNIKEFNDSIHKNLPLMKSGGEKNQLKSTSKIPNLNNDVNLFSRMYIACQVRESDMDTFFKHGNNPWPPSLASNGIMHSTNKSDLMSCLESMASTSESVPKVDAKIIDGSTEVHILDPKKCTQSVKTFKDYAKYIFLPFIQNMLQNVVRWMLFGMCIQKTVSKLKRDKKGGMLIISKLTTTH